MISFVLLFVCLFYSAASQPFIPRSVKPFFSCWYTTYVTDVGRQPYIVFGYNTTIDPRNPDYPLIIIQDSNLAFEHEVNKLYVDGTFANPQIQPTRFTDGNYPAQLIIPAHTSIQWTIERRILGIESQTLFVNVTSLGSETLCRNVFKNRCDDAIFTGGTSTITKTPGYFCEDNVFCNGLEFCSRGVCQNNKDSCPFEACNEVGLFCGEPEPFPFNRCIVDTDCGLALLRYCVYEDATQFGYCRNASCNAGTCAQNLREDMPCLRYVCCQERNLCFSKTCNATETCDATSKVCVPRLNAADLIIPCSANEECDSALDELCVNGRCQVVPCLCGTPTCHLLSGDVAGCYSKDCNAARHCYPVMCTAVKKNTALSAFIFIFFFVIITVKVCVYRKSFMKRK